MTTQEHLSHEHLNHKHLSHHQVSQEQLRKGFVLGEWTVWPNAGQIEQNGSKSHIEPKLVEVLLLLAQMPGQVVSREQLLDHAWQRQVVCDEALTRTISELRTLLGDSSSERRYIRTIPKRGYSLIADVRPIPALSVSKTTAEQIPARYQGLTHGSAWIPTASFTNRLIKAWLYGVGSVATACSALFVVMLFVAKDLSVSVMSGESMTMTTPENYQDALIAPNAPVLRHYAVLPFTNLTPDQELGAFTHGLEEDLRTALSGLNGAKVAGRIVSDQFHASFLNDTSSGIQEIAERLQVDAILDGTVRLIDGQVRVTVQLLDGKTGFPLWSKRYDKAFDRVLKLQTFISDDVHCELESRLPKINSQYLAAKNKAQQQKTVEAEISAPSQDYGHTRHVEWLAR
jgi:DNA-binding winged helix-turn-helix (wHTH) protein/TolB-like protein